ncbi:phage tail length tape measure family protein [uncultured Sphingomonas sp.]|uniref:phage tail length tape measure family protein n=1 Tax=uncultured Sphingomonas sp. TaxID=158754 RepID=UPI00259A618A|nr:phage tail length tape measure family protein [uncultured Sphingomonas sp.]
MEEDDGLLTAGFAIDTQGAFSELQRFYQFFDQGTIRVLDEMAQIEKATGGMMQLGPATREVSAFSTAAKRELVGVKETADTIATGVTGLATAFATTGSAATREARALAREKTATATAGEALIRQLTREADALGKTKEEMRAAKVEAIALAASQQGNTDLADRLLAAARAREASANAVAEAEEAAARRIAAATEQQAQALRSAAVAHQMFEAKVREGVVAMAAADREAAQFEAAVTRVQNRIDPSAASLAKLRTELDEAKAAFDRGRIGAEGFEQEQARIVAAAGKLYGPQRELTSVTQELGVAQRFTANETLNLSRQFQDIGVTAAMGMNPLMIMVQQGPQIYDVLAQARQRGVGAAAAFAQMGKDVTGYAVAGLQRLLPLLNPTTLGLAATAVAVVAVGRAMGSYGAALERFETTASGIGRTSGQTAAQLEKISEAAAVSGERSLSATRDSVAAFAAAGIQGEQTLTGLASVVDKYAKLTGQDAPAAQAALAQAMKDPAAAADTFTQSLGLLTGAQYEHIRQLSASGDQEKAASELTRILTADIAANSHQTTGLAHVMDMLGNAVSGVSTMFGKLDQRIRQAGASYDAWLKKNIGGWAVDLIGTGNQMPKGPNPNAGRNQDQIAALNISGSMNTSGMREINTLLQQQRVIQKGLADTTGLTSTQVQRLQHDYAAVTDTLNANRNASGAWITTQERAHLIAVAQDKLASARTQKEKAAAQQQITRLQLGTQVLTNQERQTQALDAYNKVADKYSKPKTDHHAATLVNEAKAVEAQITNLYKLADAYRVSGAAALLAEARVKAESEAIKKKGDIEEFIARQQRLAIAQRVMDANRASASLNDQSAVQERANRMVEAGLLPMAKASQYIQDQVALLPTLAALRAAAEIKDQKAYAESTRALNNLTAAQDRFNTARQQAQYDSAMKSGGEQIEQLQLEGRLIGANDAARTHALATLKATQEAAKFTEMSPDKQQAYIDQQVKIADVAFAIAQAQRDWNEALTFTADKWDLIARNVQNAASGMADAFGAVGKAIGDVGAIYATFAAQRERSDQAHRSALAASGSEAERDRIDAKFALQNATARIGLYGDMTAAAKGFFKEGSDGYKAMATAEKVFRAVEFALSVKSIAQDAVETGSKLASSAARTAAHAVEAVVKAISSLPFPLNIAAGAATIAALAGIGVSVVGALSGGNKNTLAPANSGTGTVLGNSEAKSESIKNAIDALKAVDLITNSYSRQMAASLKSIDSQIGNVASLVVRSGVNDSKSTVAEGFKPNTIGSLLGNIPLIGGFLSSLFGSKTTVLGNGLYGGAQSLGSILSGGFNAQAYTDIEKTSKFLGITTSKKTSTQYNAVDPTLGNQFTLILRSFNDAINAAAGPLGQSTQAIQDRLNGFVVNIGKIDLKGLTGDQIQEKLNAVFGAAADNMAAAAFPGIERFQKVGEGAFQTLVRVSSTVEAVTTALDQLGASTRSLGIDAKLGLADQFDSMSDLTSAVGSYFDAFYSKEEQAAAKTQQLTTVFGSLGLTLPATLAGFRQLVEAQDLSTAAGQATYATLLKLAPAFADLKSSMEGAKSAADILSEQQNLQRQLLELNGDTAAIRALDLAKVDVSNRALQEQVWAIQDAQKAADAAKQLSDAWSSVGNSIEDEIKRIRGLSDNGGAGSFAQAMGQFNAATIAARGGDMDAAKSLPGLSQALLKLAADNATSRQELDRVQAQTAASLEQTNAVIAAIANGNPLTAATSTVAAAASTAQTSAPAAAAANDDVLTELKSLREEVAGMRKDNSLGQAAIAGHARRTADTLDTVTRESGGTAVAVASAA